MKEKHEFLSWALWGSVIHFLTPWSPLGDNRDTSLQTGVRLSLLLEEPYLRQFISCRPYQSFCHALVI